MVTQRVGVGLLPNIRLKDGQGGVVVIAKAQFGKEALPDAFARVNAGNLDDKELLIVGGDLEHGL